MALANAVACNVYDRCQYFLFHSYCILIYNCIKNAVHGRNAHVPIYIHTIHKQDKFLMNPLIYPMISQVKISPRIKCLLALPFVIKSMFIFGATLHSSY